MNQDDGLPDKICTTCDTKLESFTQFRESCAQTDEILRERLNEEAKIKIEKFEMEFEDSSNDAALFPLDFIDQNSDSNDSTSTAYENNLQRLYDDCTFEDMEKSLVKKYKQIKTEEQNEPSKNKIVKEKVKLEKIYNCETCGKLFDRKHSLKRHGLIHSKNKILNCNGNSNEYIRPNPQINTIDTNERVSIIKSDGSEHIAPVKEDFATRKPRKKKKIPNQCMECGKFLASPGGLKRHIFRHLNLKPHPCELCGRKFAETGDVKKHIRLFHLKLQKKFQCNICGKVLVDSSSHKVN